MSPVLVQLIFAALSTGGADEELADLYDNAPNSVPAATLQAAGWRSRQPSY
jgi:hypothetical protein